MGSIGTAEQAYRDALKRAKDTLADYAERTPHIQDDLDALEAVAKECADAKDALAKAQDAYLDALAREAASKAYDVTDSAADGTTVWQADFEQAAAPAAVRKAAKAQAEASTPDTGDTYAGIGGILAAAASLLGASFLLRRRRD